MAADNVQRESSIRIISRAQYRAMPWRNGRGTTHEIVREPDGAAEFSWRLSLADVPASGPFSAFAGYERIVVLVTGEGFSLDFGPHGGAELTPDSRIARFAGDWQTSCTLRGGPCSDLSWMVRRTQASADASVLELRERGSHHWARGAWGVFFCIRGAVELSTESGQFALADWDTALIPPTCERRWILEPKAGVSVVACLSALAHAQAELGPSGITS